MLVPEGEMGTLGRRSIGARVDDQKNLPLWWNSEFLNLQAKEVRIFETQDVRIPFVSTRTGVEVGFVGPYAGALHPGHGGGVPAVREAWRKLKNQEMSAIRVRLPPLAVFPEINQTNREALELEGGRLLYEDLNQSLDLTNNPQLNRLRRRDLAKSVQMGLGIRESSVGAAFELIQANRADRGYPMTITYPLLARLQEGFPSKILALSCFRGNEVGAASLVFRVSSRVSYVFLWGRNPNADFGSEALTRLAIELADQECDNGATILCLGVSSELGRPNEGLLRYKKSLGALTSGRPVYELIG